MPPVLPRDEHCLSEIKPDFDSLDTKMRERAYGSLPLLYLKKWDSAQRQTGDSAAEHVVSGLEDGLEPGQDLIFYLVDQGAGEEAAAFGGGDTVYPNLSQVVLTADNRVAAGDVVVIQPVPEGGWGRGGSASRERSSAAA